MLTPDLRIFELNPAQAPFLLIAQDYISTNYGKFYSTNSVKGPHCYEYLKAELNSVEDIRNQFLSSNPNQCQNSDKLVDF
jgi:hypothetical protein